MDLHAPYALRNVLEIESEDGIVGIAETYGGDAPAQALEGLRTQVIGADAYRLTGKLAHLVEGHDAGFARSQTYLVPGENPLDAATRTYAAIETACLDLIGKSIGKPICDLIGGRVRDKVPFSAYAFYKHVGGGGEGDDVRADEYGEVMTPEALIREVKQMIEHYGFGSVKLKGGVLEPKLEIESVKRLRSELGPEVPLRIDPNCAWATATSVAVGKELTEELSSGGYLEDPTSTLEGMSEVRKQLLAAGVDNASGFECRGHFFRGSSAERGTRCRANRSLRFALLGRYAAGATPCYVVPRVQPGSVYAFQQSSGSIADGNGPCGGRHAPLDLCLRHPLPVAVGS